ncbi:hypothetical protein G7Y41_08585 [Schaalia sp. ZJ405]|uniref:hypothetical protein n=1 Tax=Schaalia sp. ZJ405 TaxID=2709403 RepID=UPI0013ECE2A6|nr:hypothetical protein [Schaalia sp. ZJ405]QPK81082.1 hypothetical protein G7Y41_08585 [Schaalia sp. ZJ405]
MARTSGRVPAFTDQQIELGFWFLVGWTRTSAAEREEIVSWARTQERRDEDEQAILPLCEKNRVDEDERALILALIAWARQSAAVKECPSVSVGKIDAARAEILARWRVESHRGALVWPPRSRTIAVRLGDGNWADALRRFDIPVSPVGRQRGSGRFTSESFRSAFAEFLEFCQRQQEPVTLNGYGRWSGSERERGRAEVPSLASVRQRYGTWMRALQELEEFSCRSQQES